MYALQNLQNEIEKAVEKAAGKKLPLVKPPKPEMGDFGVFSKDPLKFGKLTGIKEVKSFGPYHNFFIDYDYLANEVLKEAVKKDYSSGKEKKKILIEYSSPNPNKPQHMGHVRNDVIGMAVSNLLEFEGNKVNRVIWINDTGIHICKAMLAYQKWGKNATPESTGIKPDHFVLKYYVMFGNEAEKHPELKEEAQEMLRKWNAGDKEVHKLWEKIVAWAYTGWDYTYKKLGCKFDKWYYESKEYQKGIKIVEDGIKKGIFTRDKDNSVFANLEKYNLPNTILIRSDGTPLYATPDFSLWTEKQKDYSPDISITVVGSAHQMYFQQFFKMLELLGNKWAKNCYHLSYGMVSLPEGKMSSRTGTGVFADDVIKEVTEKAKQEIEKRGKVKDIELSSDIIGIGALKFAMLKIDADKDIIFDKEKSVSFDGDTGPYVQYAYVRCNSILEKEKPKGEKILIIAPEEKNLVRKIAELPEVVSECAKHYQTHLLANYLLELTHLFSKFYDNCPVLTGENKDTRLQIVAATKNVLKIGLNLLGIESPEKM